MTQEYDLQQIALNEVSSSGESVVWVGRPDPKRFALQRLPFFLFGIPWTAFALFWLAAASGFKFPNFNTFDFFSLFPLFGIPFVLIGFGMLLSPLYAYTKAFNTVYVITNRSLRIIQLGNTKKVQTFTANEIGTIQRIEKNDGSGTLIFKQNVSYDSQGRSTVTAIGFYGIPDVRTVEQYVSVLRTSSTPQSSNASI